MTPERVGHLCDKLAHSYKQDFINFMRDMNRDIENDLRGEPQGIANEVVLIVNTSLLAMWLGVEMAHLEPHVAEWMLTRLVEEINECTPHLREVLKKIEENNGHL